MPFLDAISHKLDASSADASAGTSAAAIVEDVGSNLSARANARQRKGNPLRLVALLIFLPLLGWWGWSSFASYANERTRRTAAGVIAALPAMQGYPAKAESSDIGRSLRISGLAPSQEVKNAVLSRLTMALPQTQITETLAVVPGSDITIPVTEPKFDAVRRDVQSLQQQMVLSAVVRAAERTSARIANAQDDLKTATANEADAGKKAKIAASSDEIAGLAKLLSGVTTGLNGVAAIDDDTGKKLTAEFDNLAARMKRQTAALGKLIGRPDRDAPRPPSADTIMAAEAMAADAERLFAMASVISATSSLKPVEIPAIPPPEPRAVLQAWTERNAVFFDTGTQYRDPAATGRALDELVALMRNAGALVRVAGYTDLAGKQPTNATLGQERANKVRQDLIARGAPSERLVAVGRGDALDLSPVQGAGSPNRRVVFEIGYDGEMAQ